MTNFENSSSQDSLYQQVVDTYGEDMARFAAGYERNEAARQDLLQEVHLALWRSLAGFKGQCSLRTWVYRVAHNVGVTHVQRSMRIIERHGIDIDEIQSHADEQADIVLTDRRIDLERVMAIVHSLGVLDRQLMLLYLEDLDAAAIGEITGLSASNVSTKIHRIKSLLAARLGNRSKSP